jgi:hypothetical protein
VIDEYDLLFYTAMTFLLSFWFAVYQISAYIKENKELNDKIDNFDKMISAASYTIIKLEMENRKLLKLLSQIQTGHDHH